MKLSDYILQFLEDKNVANIFFVPGGGCMHLLDSLAKSETIEGITFLHEQGATIAAESYAFSSGSVGVSLLTTGPGGTNGITGVLSAYVDSIPCFILSGQVKTSDLKDRFGVRSHGSQEADIIGMVKGITKYSFMITEKESIRYHLEKAWHEATTGRKGPVWLDIPLDIQGSQINPEKLIGYVPEPTPDCQFKKEIAESIRLIGKAKKPIIIVGNGVRGAEAEFYQLLNKLSIPVIPTWKAVDLIANNHPLFVGKCGTLGERAANFAMQTADLIISLGSKLDFSITGFDRSRWATKAKKIIVEIDETEIYKLQTNIEVPVVGDVKQFIKALNAQEIKGEDVEKWKRKIESWKNKYPVKAETETKDTCELSTYDLVDAICKQISKETVIVPSCAGTVAEITYQALNVKQGQMVRGNSGLGAMGYEIPSAIGAYFATKKQIVTIAGDGGMQLNIQELAILAGRNLPIKIFVANNGGYSSIRNMQRNHFEGRYIGSNEDTGLFLPDMTALATAYGIKSRYVATKEDLEMTITEALQDGGPFLCDVKIDSSCIVSPRSASKVMADGSIISTPLEDLFPFLPDKVLEEELKDED